MHVALPFLPVVFRGFLGRYARHAIESVCQAILDATPNTVGSDLQTAWDQFARTSEPLIDQVPCICNRCISVTRGWSREIPLQVHKECPRRKTWKVVGNALNAALHCLLVKTHGSVAIAPVLDEHSWFWGPAEVIINRHLKISQRTSILNAYELY